MSDPSNLTFETLQRTYQEFKHRAALTGDTVAGMNILVSSLMNFVEGYWQVEHQGKTYLLIGRPQFAQVISELPLIEDGRSTILPQGYIGTLYGIPILEADDLARDIIMGLLAQHGERLA